MNEKVVTLSSSLLAYNIWLVFKVVTLPFSFLAYNISLLFTGFSLEHFPAIQMTFQALKANFWR